MSTATAAILPSTKTYPLAPLLEGMLFNHLARDSSGVDIEQHVCTFHEQVDTPCLARAWQTATNRHQALRSEFHWSDRAQPVQIFRDSVPIGIEEFDWRDLAAGEQNDRLDTFLADDRRRGFDLTQSPLFRLACFRLAEEEYKLVWTFQHIILDGRAVRVIFNEVFALYEALCRHEEFSLAPPGDYSDFLEWLQNQDFSAAEAYWRDLLKGFANPTRLAVDRGNNRDSAFLSDGHSRYSTIEVRLSEEQTSALGGLARQYGLTVNTLVQGAWGLLLSRYSGEEDVVFGATRACRHASVPGAENMVGFFINTLPVRVRAVANMPLVAWLQDLRRQHVALRSVEHTPLARVREWSDVPGDKPLFETLLVFENYALETALHAQGGAWLRREFRLLEQPGFPLTVAAYLGSELTLRLSYDESRFDDQTAAHMAGHLRTLLEEMAGDPLCRLSELRMLTAAERHELLCEWNQTARDYPLETCLHELFETQVERTPDAVAVVFQEQQLTYRQLNERANQLAHYLRGMGVGPESLVGICLPRSMDMVAALLAVLKAGGAYVPLDPAYPIDRLSFMLEDARVAVLLTQEQLKPIVHSHHARVVCVDADRSAILRESVLNLPHTATADNLAYVIYTSGSTGQPKGVMICHRGVCNYLNWRLDYFPLTAADRLLQTASISFDDSVWQIFEPLSVGAMLILVEPGAEQDMACLVRLILKHQITAACLVPSLLWAFLEVPGVESCRCLRRFTTGGEAVTPELQSRFFSLLSASFYNLYGPTETTISSTCWKCERDHETVPIGRPIANVEVFVLDGDLQPTPIGVPGELDIGGIGLARGYLNRPELTAERFIPHPFSNQAGARLYKTGDRVRWSSDGNLEFLGRTDGQVKLRGFRIELDEIEAVVRTHPAVSETVVILQDAQSARARLVCYFTPRGSRIPSASELSSFLSQNLPRHAIPAVWVKLDTLPLNANGKVDREALPAPETSRLEPGETYAAPRTPVEELLTGIWCDLLGVERVGIHDNFFDLGGHSLLAIQLFARIEQQFQKRLPLALLFQHGTVSGIARHLTDEVQDDRDAAVVELQPGAAGQRCLFFMPNLWGELNDGRKLLGHLEQATPVYGVQPRLSADGLEKSADFEGTAAACVEALREFQPHGPYALIGYSYGGMLAYEVARQIVELGDVVDLLVILDTGPANRGHVSTASEHFARWVRVLRNLPRWIVDDANNSPRDLYWRALRRLRLIAPPKLLKFIGRVKGANYEIATDTAGIARQNADRGAAKSEAVREYMPKAYPGVVTLFRSRTQPVFAGSRDDLGWHRFALGGVDVRLVPGHHLVLMDEPYVGRVAAELQKCLRGLEAGEQR